MEYSCAYWGVGNFISMEFPLHYLVAILFSFNTRIKVVFYLKINAFEPRRMKHGMAVPDMNHDQSTACEHDGCQRVSGGTEIGVGAVPAPKAEGLWKVLGGQPFYPRNFLLEGK